MRLVAVIGVVGVGVFARDAQMPLRSKRCSRNSVCLAHGRRTATALRRRAIRTSVLPCRVPGWSSRTTTSALTSRSTAIAFCRQSRCLQTNVSVQVIFQPGTAVEERQKLVFSVNNNTRRTIFNQSDGGAMRVKDGIALARGSKTPLLRKCEEGRVSH